ncbi:vomeronasal type-2 receptor 26-like [Mantella aurantiaca]
MGEPGVGYTGISLRMRQSQGSDSGGLSNTKPSPSPACRLQIVSAYEDYEFVQDGDIIIGGVFTVNCFMAGYRIPGKPNVTDMFCMKPMPQYYKKLQMFLFAIDQVNKNPNILPNVTLGYHLYDSCSNQRKAIKSVLQILSGPGETVPNYSCRGRQKLAGFIGDQNSVTTLPIARLLSVYNHVQVSYGATDLSLANTAIYPTFYRTVQDDNIIFHSVAKLIRHFGWTWVGIITSNDESGEREGSWLSIFFSHLQICVAFLIQTGISALTPERSHLQKLYDIVRRLSVKVIVLCGTYHDEVFWIKEMFRDVTLILPPHWAPNIADIQKFPQVFNCSLSFNFYSEADAKFKRFVDRFHPAIYPKDKLLENMWMTILFCLSGSEHKDRLYESTYRISLRSCTGLERIADNGDYSSDRTSDPVYRAVELMVKGLHFLHSSQKGCNADGRAQDEEKCRRKLNWHIKRLPRMNGFIVYKADKELFSPFIVQNHIFVNKTLYTKVVGDYRCNASDFCEFEINHTLIEWKNKKNQIPRSQCSESCLPGYRQVPGFSIQSCCHGCVLCSYGEISNTTDSINCMKCPDHEFPNENRTLCISKQVEFLSFTDDKLSLACIVVSFLFFIKSLSVLVIFIFYQNTPVVKANNKGLSFVLLVSIMLGFLCVFLFLGRPVDITCLLRHVSFGILFTIAVSSVLAKTIIVCIAFKDTKPGSVWKKWIGLKLPICIVSTCSSVQVIICINWLAISPPFQELDTHTYQEMIIIQCNEGSIIGLFSVLGYIGILAAVSFIIAFLARTLPDTFNEAKYITFSMLVFCSVWIAMIPAYLSTKGKYTVAVEIFAILISNSGLLYCIFLPKCFIILCRPQLNTKSFLQNKRNTITSF